MEAHKKMLPEALQTSLSFHIHKAEYLSNRPIPRESPDTLHNHYQAGFLCSSNILLAYTFKSMTSTHKLPDVAIPWTINF